MDTSGIVGAFPCFVFNSCAYDMAERHQFFSLLWFRYETDVRQQIASQTSSYFIVYSNLLPLGLRSRLTQTMALYIILHAVRIKKKNHNHVHCEHLSLLMSGLSNVEQCSIRIHDV